MMSRYGSAPSHQTKEINKNRFFFRMRKTILAAALVLASGQAFAETDPNSPTVMSNFSYDYLEARIGASPVTFGAAASLSLIHI